MEDVEALFEFEGVEEPPDEEPPPRWRWFLLGGLAVVLVAAMLLIDDPEPAPEPEALVPPSLPGAFELENWAWVPSDMEWGSAVVHVEGGLLVGNRSWNGRGGWALVGWDGRLTRTPLGELPIDPVADRADDGTVWVAGRDIAGTRVVAVDPDTGDLSTIDLLSGERPLSIEVDDGTVRILTDAGVRAWTQDTGWLDPSKVGDTAAIAATLESAMYRATVAIQTGELDPPGPAVRPSSVVRTSEGPGWEFLEACDGSSCDRWSRPDGGGWVRSPDLPGLPRWNGSEWWAAVPWAGRTEPTVHLSADGLAWETVRAPNLSLASDEMVIPTVLPGRVIVLTLLRPDGTQEVFVGERS